MKSRDDSWRVADRLNGLLRRYRFNAFARWEGAHLVVDLGLLPRARLADTELRLRIVRDACAWLNAEADIVHSGRPFRPARNAAPAGTLATVGGKP